MGKWQLLNQCIIHFYITLNMSTCEKLTNSYSNSEIVLQDFLSHGPAITTIFNVLKIGIKKLFHTRKFKTWGDDIEQCILSSFRLFVRIFSLDNNYLKLKVRTTIMRSFEVVMFTDYKIVLSILTFIRYPYNAQIQKCAICINHFLIKRMEKKFMPFIQSKRYIFA